MAESETTTENSNSHSTPSVRKSGRKRKPKVSQDFLTFDEFRMPARRPAKKLKPLKKSSLKSQLSLGTHNSKGKKVKPIYFEVISNVMSTTPNMSFESLLSTVKESFNKNNSLPLDFPDDEIVFKHFTKVKDRLSNPSLFSNEVQVDPTDLQFFEDEIRSLIAEKPRSTFVTVFKKMSLSDPQSLTGLAFEKYGLDGAKKICQECFTCIKSRRKSRPELENNFYVNYMKYLVAHTPSLSSSDVLKSIQVMLYKKDTDKIYPGDKIIKKYYKTWSRKVKTAVQKNIDPKTLLETESVKRPRKPKEKAKPATKETAANDPQPDAESDVQRNNLSIVE